MTKIDIISGFLGAGKTTLIKKLLQEALVGQKTMLIENEFGEIGIDGGFLKESGIEITEMNSGCICCSLVGDFETSLKEAISTYHPERIIIEPSGVGKLSDVIRAVKVVETEPDVMLNSAAVVVDAMKVKMYMKNFGEFYSNQIEHAGTIILSRTDKLNDSKLEAVIAMLREVNNDAAIITTPWDELDCAKILESIEGSSKMEEELMKEVHEHHHHHHDGEECCCGHHHGHGHEHHHHDGEECCCGHHHGHEHEHHHHHADEVFVSWGLETAVAYTMAEIENKLAALANEEKYGIILRAKGMVRCAECSNWIHFDYVPGESNVRSGSAEVIGKICVIGSKMKEDAIAELFSK
ncbi:MAG: GTP-binding protein [Lachnospiraceae bacterium]|nr:GTP-binding protein [Lachnospiraceae bacterium]